jgi:hypothetical protein
LSPASWQVCSRESRQDHLEAKIRTRQVPGSYEEDLKKNISIEITKE